MRDFFKIGGYKRYTAVPVFRKISIAIRLSLEFLENMPVGRPTFHTKSRYEKNYPPICTPNQIVCDNCWLEAEGWQSYAS